MKVDFYQFTFECLNGHGFRALDLPYLPPSVGITADFLKTARSWVAGGLKGGRHA